MHAVLLCFLEKSKMSGINIKNKRHKYFLYPLIAMCVIIGIFVTDNVRVFAWPFVLGILEYARSRYINTQGGKDVPDANLQNSGVKSI